MTDDLISRQAAIDEIRRCRFVVDAIEKISKLPSAQPELAQNLHTTCADTISRQAAIDTLRAEFKRTPTNAIRAMNALKGLPPAQQEIIRCEDCKLFGDEKCLMCFDGYDWAEPYGYCHCAERRTDETD